MRRFWRNKSAATGGGGSGVVLEPLEERHHHADHGFATEVAGGCGCSGGEDAERREWVKDNAASASRMNMRTTVTGEIRSSLGKTEQMFWLMKMW